MTTTLNNIELEEIQITIKVLNKLDGDTNSLRIKPDRLVLVDSNGEDAGTLVRITEADWQLEV